MNVNGPAPMPSRSPVPSWDGSTEAHPENLLRDAVRLAAVITGAMALVILQDGAGVWFRDGIGLTKEQLADTEAFFSRGHVQESGVELLQQHGLYVVGALPLLNPFQHVIGTLGVLSVVPVALSETQQDGLRLVADHIQKIVAMDHQKRESRQAPRAPSSASFVPGLIHELCGFIFGITASLDAFEARFAELTEVAKYGGNIRKSMDRMSAFVVELREFGNPNRLSWTTCDLESLLRAVLEHLSPSAKKYGINLRLDLDGALPSIDADEQSLRTAFTHVINLLLLREESRGEAVIHISTNRSSEVGMICGFLDCAGVVFENIDPARLFEPFYFRVSGLGRLALPGARRIFEAHGGMLTAGPGPNGCLRISFKLPAAVHDPLRSANPI